MINRRGRDRSFFTKYLYKYWKLQLIVMLSGLIALPLSLLNPYLTKLVIDKAFGNKDIRLFITLAVIGASVFILNGLISSFAGYLSTYISRRVNFDITKDLFRHLQNLPLSFFDNHSTGEHIYRINQDVGSVSSFVCNTIPQAITLFPRLLFILAIVFVLNRKMAILVILLVPITYIRPYLFGRWLKEITSKNILKSQGIFQKLQEIFSHIRLVKAFGKERSESDKFGTLLKNRMEFDLKNAKVTNASGFSASIFNRAISGFIVLYGGYQVIQGSITLGSLTATMIYLTQLIGILGSIGSFYQTVTVSSINRQRLSDIFDIKPAICDTAGSLPFIIKKGRIEFKDLSFGYNENAPVLKGLNLSIEPGSKIALVGPSGSGKTTILSLILRLYEQQKGIIAIDEHDIKTIRLDSLKSQIGIALQEPLLWNDTIANNILYGADIDSTRQDVIRAARLAEAHDFVAGLPNQYDSIIGEMACKLSEGQKQRIAIARALIRRPKILILDEALSSVDSETESKIIDNVKREFSDITFVIVSHRPSTVEKMDLVYSMENGSTIKISKNDHRKELCSNPIQSR